MTPEEIIRQAAEALNNDPELARRHREMRALLEHAQSVADMVYAYKVGCMHPTAPPRQIEETEQAMFTACHMLLQMFMAKAVEGDEVGQQWVVEIMKECSNYAASRFALLNSMPTAH
jgi:hypothetical protein